MRSKKDEIEATESGQDPRLFVAAIDRTMRVVKAFGTSNDLVSIGEIAKRTGLGRSAVQRIVYTLHQLGYLSREQDKRLYKLTTKIIDLCHGLIGPDSAAQKLLPLLRDLAEKTGETTAWVQLEIEEIVILQAVRSRHLGHVALSLGQRFAALPSSSGQVILAHSEPRVAEWLLQTASSDVCKRLSFSTISEMHEHLNLIREKGYALTAKKEDQFSVSLSVPVLGQTGEVLGAINVSALESRCPRDMVDEKLAPLLVRVADEASAFFQLP